MDAKPYSVVKFVFSSFSTDSDLMVMCYNQRFHITLLADHFAAVPDIEETYRRFLQVAEEGELDEDSYEWILDPFVQLFETVACDRNGGPTTLQEFLFPKTVGYTLVATKEGLQVKPHHNEAQCDQCEQPRFGDYDHLSQELCSFWPSLHPTDVQVEDVSGTAGIVYVGDTIHFLKRILPGDAQSVQRELSIYRSIEIADPGKSLHVPRLHGLVRDKSRGLVFGLLLSYVDGSTLYNSVACDTMISLRQKWGKQIKVTLGHLHEAGIIWGDAKPDNVLIDKQNYDACICDFGGGYTAGWVEKEKAGTVQGDMQGLVKILEYIYFGSLALGIS
ncbi:hypothetical protein M422DRAFT_210551 [Sphaerobolus stellatus SS14]|uniref:Protein kinase domain-containing protein n=1 Tax=Sphaerobolus stellatus (strain SS14) TaxID=990650 RepID=A0A0C9VBU7_SPHS4|nr:hypothetical protein M422DRAFT_210551 [Sphaerobolus stellatus SS14]